MRKNAAVDQTVQFDKFVSKLYRSGLSVDPEAFRGLALEALKELVPFDGAIWGSGNVKNWRFHSVTTVDLPDEFPAALEKGRSLNPLAEALIRQQDVPIDMESVCPDEKFFKSEYYKKYMRKFGIRRILTTGHADPRTGLLSMISLYRCSRSNRFTDFEKSLYRSAVFHLFESASHAYFVHLSRAFRPERTPGGASAVVDSTGGFHEAQPRFIDLLDEHFPDRSLEHLPFPIPDAGQTEEVNGLCMRSQPLGDLQCVVAWPAGPLDRLTDRERQIVFAVTRGLSFKQVAQMVKVAPSTVANHLYRVYRKLGVTGRSQLATLVHPPEKPA